MEYFTVGMLVGVSLTIMINLAAEIYIARRVARVKRELDRHVEETRQQLAERNKKILEELF